MSRFGSQEKNRDIMKHMTKIVIFSLCAALTMSACNKNVITPDEDNQRVPLSFTALSQIPTKATTPLTTDFGVWGIARKADHQDYILWPGNTLNQVTGSGSNYTPAADAYWLVGYKYNFIAVAPYTDGVSGLEMRTSQVSSEDALTFTFDQGAKYTSSDYDFDLLGAVAENEEYTKSDPSTQTLTFWHLFAKIIINVNFVNADGTAAGADTYNVSEIRLCNVGSKADYTIYGVGDDINVSCSTPTETKNLTFSNSATNNVLHLIPQDITDFELYIDFVRDGVAFDDFKAALSFGGKNPSVYNYNEVYNWNITIGPKNAISFQVEVAPWGEVDVNDDAPIEII